MTTFVKIYPETSDTEQNIPYQKIEFGPVGYTSFITHSRGFSHGILLLEGVLTKNPQHIISLLNGSLKEGSNINVALSELLDNKRVKAIVIDINGTPIMMDGSKPDYTIYLEWKNSYNKLSLDS